MKSVLKLRLKQSISSEPSVLVRGNFEGKSERVKLLWCRGRDSNPHGLSANGFSYHYDFRRLLSVRGLDDAFSLHP